MALPRLPLSMQRSVADRAEHRAVKRRAIERAAQVMQFKRRAGAALLASISSPQQRGFPNGGTKLVSECGRHRRVSRARKVVITNGCGRYGVHLTACAVLANSRGLRASRASFALLQSNSCVFADPPMSDWADAGAGCPPQMEHFTAPFGPLSVVARPEVGHPRKWANPTPQWPTWPT
jgi:hypothetical protein